MSEFKWEWKDRLDVSQAFFKDQHTGEDIWLSVGNAFGEWLVSVQLKGGYSEGWSKDTAKAFAEKVGKSLLYHDLPRVSHADLYDFLVCTQRYAMGRRSHVTQTAHWMVKRYWKHLRAGEREVLTRDLKEELERVAEKGTTLGDECDDKGWKTLLAWCLEHANDETVGDSK